MALDNYVLRVVKQERCIKQEIMAIQNGLDTVNDYISENNFRLSYP